MSEPASAPVEPSTTAMGSWYATVLFWKPQLALFVSESTLLPVLMPLAPAASVIDWFPAAVATVLEAHDVHRSFIEHEVASVSDHRLVSKSRSADVRRVGRIA